MVSSLPVDAWLAVIGRSVSADRTLGSIGVCSVSFAADERGEEGAGVGQPSGHPAEVGRGNAG